MHCYTSISYSYLDRARILAETVKQHHPDWTLWLLLSDEEPPGFHFDISREKFDHVVTVRDLGIPNLNGWMFKHNVVEMCTAVKGQMLCHLFDRGAESAVYIDPDIAVFSPLEAVSRLLAEHSVLLTPHILEPEENTLAILDNEIGSLKHGVYNLGFVAVRNDDEGRRFARWWRDRTLEWCYEDVPNGIFTDQRWCDLAPAFFPGCAIVRDPGYNVASWNLGKRPIEFTSSGSILAGGVPLRFFHFTKVQGAGEDMLVRYARGQTEVFDLLRWYRGRLEHHRPDGLPDRWWKYGHYSDGQSIPQSHRVAWRARPDLHGHFVNPFLSGGDSFQTWAETHA